MKQERHEFNVIEERVRAGPFHFTNSISLNSLNVKWMWMKQRAGEVKWSSINAVHSSFHRRKRNWTHLMNGVKRGWMKSNQSLTSLKRRVDWLIEFGVNGPPLLSHSIYFNWIEMKQLEWYYNSIYLVDCNKNIDVWWRKLSMHLADETKLH